jgi:hypothetical protein
MNMSTKLRLGICPLREVDTRDEFDSVHVRIFVCLAHVAYLFVSLEFLRSKLLEEPVAKSIAIDVWRAAALTGFEHFDKPVA